MIRRLCPGSYKTGVNDGEAVSSRPDGSIARKWPPIDDDGVGPESVCHCEHWRLLCMSP